MENEHSQALHAYVDGHVQGVGFRYYVDDLAQSLALTGWVRNLYDGRVEVWAEGSREELNRMLTALQRGPSRSMVTEVKFDWVPAKNSYRQFSILPTE